MTPGLPLEGTEHLSLSLSLSVPVSVRLSSLGFTQEIVTLLHFYTDY